MGIKDMSSIRKRARAAGLLYLLLALTFPFSLIYVPNTIIASGDAAATASNIAASEFLFRAGIASGLVSNILFVFLVLALYRLFKDVSRKLALLMVTLVVIAVAATFANTVNQVAALTVLGSADFLAVFEKPQLDALAYLFLRLHSQGLQVIQVFWGLWLFPFGLLVYKCRFIPKILGVLLMIAGFAYLLSSVMSVVWPQHKATVSPVISILVLAEVPIIFWLLIVGAMSQSEEPKSRS